MLAGNAATIACVLGDPRLLARVSAAIRSEGGHGVALSHAAVLDAAATRTIRALIYDMGSYGRSTVDFIRRVRTVRPDWPIWLYYTPRPAFVDSVAEVMSLRGVWATPQVTDPAQEADLRLHVRRLLGSLPRVRLLALLDPILRALPPAVRVFLEGSLEGREPTDARRAPVRDAGAGLPGSPKQLERLCHAAGLLPPKQLLDRMALVFLAFKALLFAVPPTRAAQELGLGARALRAIHYRVFGRDARWVELNPRAQFELALMALGDACKVPAGTTDAVLHEAAKERWA